METKMKLIERLVKDGSITLEEALLLLDDKKENLVMQPYPIPSPFTLPLAPYSPLPNPYTNPNAPMLPPYTITCSNTFDGKSIEHKISGYIN